jgi:hypothetical protein
MLHKTEKYKDDQAFGHKKTAATAAELPLFWCSLWFFFLYQAVGRHFRLAKE